MAVNLKSQETQRKLRELAGVAHTRELAAALSKLEKNFAQWLSGEIDPFTLNDHIHRFHDGASQEIFNRYRNLPPDIAVARGVALYLLQEDEVPSEFLKDLESIIQFCRAQAGRNKPADEPVPVKKEGIKATKAKSPRR